MAKFVVPWIDDIPRSLVVWKRELKQLPILDTDKFKVLLYLKQQYGVKITQKDYEEVR